MKIIKRGTPPFAKFATFTCPDCSSVLKAQRSDGEKVDQSQADQLIGVSNAYRFCCPVCATFLIVDAENFTESRDDEN